uniref:Uncharacterized protein n=1 Tax=Arundo donax TaxID=35708 RepID=A0A0A9FJQ4_ARUDO
MRTLACACSCTYVRMAWPSVR